MEEIKLDMSKLVRKDIEAISFVLGAI